MTTLTRRAFVGAGGGAAWPGPGWRHASRTLRPRPPTPTPLTPPEGLDDPAWARVRAAFALDPGTAYMNNAGLGMPPASVAAAVAQGYEAVSRDPRRGTQGLGDRIARRVRPGLAAFLGADADELSLTRNATEALHLSALGIDLRPGDEVVFTTQEHPAGRRPWQLRARPRRDRDPRGVHPQPAARPGPGRGGLRGRAHAAYPGRRLLSGHPRRPPLSGPPAGDPGARTGHSLACGRRAGRGHVPGESPRPRVRHLFRQPAQVVPGPDGHRLPVRARGRPRSHPVDLRLGRHPRQPGVRAPGHGRPAGPRRSGRLPQLHGRGRHRPHRGPRALPLRLPERAPGRDGGRQARQRGQRTRPPARLPPSSRWRAWTPSPPCPSSPSAPPSTSTNTAGTDTRPCAYRPTCTTPRRRSTASSARSRACGRPDPTAPPGRAHRPARP